MVFSDCLQILLETYDVRVFLGGIVQMILRHRSCLAKNVEKYLIDSSQVIKQVTAYKQVNINYSCE